jgi:hypothetical protein
MHVILVGKVYGIIDSGKTFCLECYGPLTADMVDDPTINVVTDRKPEAGPVNCATCKRTIRG